MLGPRSVLPTSAWTPTAVSPTHRTHRNSASGPWASPRADRSLDETLTRGGGRRPGRSPSVNRTRRMTCALCWDAGLLRCPRWRHCHSTCRAHEGCTAGGLGEVQPLIFFFLCNFTYSENYLQKNTVLKKTTPKTSRRLPPFRAARVWAAVRGFQVGLSAWGQLRWASRPWLPSQDLRGHRARPGHPCLRRSHLARAPATPGGPHPTLGQGPSLPQPVREAAS